MSMQPSRLIVYKGPASQTGSATKEAFPCAAIQQSSETFDEIAERLLNEPVLASLPMWNSHQGEIAIAKVLELLFDEKTRLCILWPCRVRFECLAKDNLDIATIRRLISVTVAESQCSDFIEETGVNFEGAPSTVEAYTAFCNDSSIDAVLCTPGQNVDGFGTLTSDAANPINFTTCALVASSSAKTWSVTQWGSLHKALFPQTRGYAGVEMPLRVSTFDDQEQLLTDLTADAKSIDEIPNVLFVARRPDGICRLIIEGEQEILSPRIITEDAYSVEIHVTPDIGDSPTRYAERACMFLTQEFRYAIQEDFIRHKGNKTCFFACPQLGMITHGFDPSVIEPVVRRMISKHFELHDLGIKCSESQQTFFETYLEDYRDKGPDFIQFRDVG